MVQVEDLSPVFEGGGLMILPQELFVGRVQVGRTADGSLPHSRTNLVSSF